MPKILNCIFIIASAMLMTGCASDGERTKVISSSANSDKMSLAEFKNKSGSLSVDAVRRYYSDRTIMNFDPIHGTQVEYIASDGSSYLWYPGNRIALPGHWSVERGLSENKLCYRYGANTYNPATRQSGTNKECEDLSTSVLFMTEIVPGDRFGLKSGRIPFVLDRGQTTIRALSEKGGRK